MRPLQSAAADPLHGTIPVPGDKSISHRALLLGAMAIGETEIAGLLEGDDVRRTAAALRILGVEITTDDENVWRVSGVGVGGFAEPDDVLDFGNSGTGARLLAGLLATHPFTSFLTGDVSLRRRPMGRIVRPLTSMGARFISRSGLRLPMAVIGAATPVPIAYTLPVASAQVKSAVLLAGLNAPATTRVVEPTPTRDHTERLLRYFGVSVRVDETPDGGRIIDLDGQPEITARKVSVPGDPSSAAFPALAAVLVPGSDLTLRGLGTNPLRTGFYATLEEMGAVLDWQNPREEGGEPVADLRVKASSLVAVEVPGSRAPAMIDEYPILAVAAAAAKGTTVLNGLGELRVKESDRLAAIADGLRACGIEVEEGQDRLAIHGTAGRLPGGGCVRTQMDHRIAMAFLTFGMASERPVQVDDGGMIETSFPGFVDRMNGIGAQIAGAGKKA